MKTNNYWPAIVSTSLITALLWGTALPLAALPGPDDYKKLQEGVNKAYLQNEADKAAAASKASPAPTPYNFYDRYTGPQKPNSTSNSGAQNSNTGMRSWAASPTPIDRSSGGRGGGRNAQGGRGASSTSAAADDWINQERSKRKTNNTYNANDPNRPKGFINGLQVATPTPSAEADESSSSDTEDWHKKNKKKHHDDDQDQGRFSGKKHWNKNSEGATGSSFDNSTYDGSPVHYNKPKPTSDTEDWHKKNKNEHHHHDDGNSTYDGSPIHYNKPKPTSDTEDWHKKNKNEHHHHDGDGHHYND